MSSLSRLRSVALFVCLGSIAACGGGGGGTPTTPAPPTTPSVTGTLSGNISSAAGGGIGGATVRITDGPNAGRSAETDGGGRYEFTGLTPSGFTIDVVAPAHVGASRGITVSPSSPNVTSNFTLLPTQLWTRSGGGNAVFEMPRYITRVRIFGRWSGGGTSNFIVRVGGSLEVNAILRDRNPYEGTHLVAGGTVEIVSSENIVEWRFTEER